ncbi:S8 family peptidase [Streptomyces californicus]
MSHSDFGGRAASGYDFIDNDADAPDCNGHGTHVAGTAAGATYGVAKGAKLVSVRVLTSQRAPAPPCPGRRHRLGHQERKQARRRNMSVGGGQAAVRRRRLTTPIASDHLRRRRRQRQRQRRHLARGRPGRDDSAPATAARPPIRPSNGQASDHGTCLDLFAPGADIVSTSQLHDTGSPAPMSGTSMASPHTAGAAALLLAAEPSLTPAQVRDKLVANATPDKISDARTGSPNRLLFTGTGGGEDPTDPPGKKFESSGQVQIRDNATVESPITVSGVSGNAPATLAVTVDIRHTFRGDLKVELVAPGGGVTVLKNYNANDSADDVRGTFTVNASSSPANGVWKLRVTDNWVNDTGNINAWSLQF